MEIYLQGTVTDLINHSVTGYIWEVQKSRLIPGTFAEPVNQDSGYLPPPFLWWLGKCQFLPLASRPLKVSDQISSSTDSRFKMQTAHYISGITVLTSEQSLNPDASRSLLNRLLLLTKLRLLRARLLLFLDGQMLFDAALENQDSAVSVTKYK